MNIDILKDNPSWKYYIWFAILVSLLVGIVYISLRSISRFVRYIGLRRASKLNRNTEGGNENFVTDDTVISWAAATGQVETLADALTAYGVSAENHNGSALISAIMNRHTDAAILLLTDPQIQVNIADAAGATALHYAALNGLADVVDLLLSKGARIEAKDRDGLTPLEWAVQGQNEDCTSLILQKTYIILSESEVLLPPLHYAAMAADIPTLQKLLDGGFDKRKRDTLGRTAEFRALQTRNLECFKEVLQRVGNIHCTDNNGLSLLHAAVEMNYLSAVSWLVSAGVSVNQMAAGSLKTPIFFLDPSLNSDCIEILETLIRGGANLRHMDSDGISLIHQLSQGSADCTNAITMLLQGGANATEQNNHGDSPHHVAAQSGNVFAIRGLAPHPEGLLMRNHEGQTPIEIAATHGKMEVVLEIYQLSGTMSLTSTSAGLELQRRMLHFAISQDDLEKLKDILQATRGDLRHDQSIFRYTILANSPKILQYLLTIGCDVQWATAPMDGVNATVLQTAIEKGCKNTYLIILDAGVSVEDRDDYGWTCLHSAVQMEDLDAVTRIAQTISNKAIKDRHGWSPYDLAYDKNNRPIMDILHDGSDEPYLPPWDDRRTKYYEGCPFSTPPGLTGAIEIHG